MILLCIASVTVSWVCAYKVNQFAISQKYWAIGFFAYGCMPLLGGIVDTIGEINSHWAGSFLLKVYWLEYVIFGVYTSAMLHCILYLEI
eukprot:UN02308